jgi:polysaccharide export outer membrane protein
MKECSMVIFVIANFAIGYSTVVLRAQQHVNANAVASTAIPPVGLGSAQPQLQQRYPRYVIQRSDVLLLSFPLSPEFDQSVTVQPDGYINLKNSTSVHVQGSTVPELVEELKKAYQGVLHDPIINVDLSNFQKPYFTASGQVGKPGQYELRDEITVAQGLAVAGGMLPTAKTQVFLFHRASQDWYEVKKVNLKQILNGKNVNEDPILKPGDMIYVPEKAIVNFRKYVPYTLNAGTYLDPATL